tara:strand:- start:6 stop:578 length:573 start_codon:yes stop_codon:yes gene_type:complete
MANEKGLMGKIMGMMTDDKGILQGGKEGRVFGRVKDSMDNNKRQKRLMEYDKLDQKGKNKVFTDFMHSTAKGEKSLLNIDDFNATGRFSSMGMFGGKRADRSDANVIEGNMFEYFENNPEQAKEYYSMLGDQKDGMVIQNEFLQAFFGREGGGDFLNKNVFPFDPMFNSDTDSSRAPNALRNPNIEDVGY